MHSAVMYCPLTNAQAVFKQQQPLARFLSPLGYLYTEPLPGGVV